MHCNGFAAYFGAGARERLWRSLPRVDRHRRSVLASSGDEFAEPTALRDSNLAIALLILDGEGLPAVHGFVPSGNFAEGESSFLDMTEEGVVAGRDLVGTRPLYVGEGGGALASDHRFLEGGRSLLPAGSVYRARDGSTTRRTSPKITTPRTVVEAGERLARLLESAVKRRVEGEERVAVSFSGGLDSALLAHCASRHTDVILCSAYTAGSRDEREAERVAEEINLPLIKKELRPDDVLGEVRALDLPFSPSPLDEALWCIYSTTARTARENGAGTILLGQLADELFGGYMKYVREYEARGGSAAQRLMEEDVARCGSAGLIRDEEACSRFVEPRFPFADESVAAFGLSLPASFKIVDGRRKYVLRGAARILGLPEEVAETPKKAAQYSSGILKLLP